MVTYTYILEQGQVLICLALFMAEILFYLDSNMCFKVVFGKEFPFSIQPRLQTDVADCAGAQDVNTYGSTACAWSRLQQNIREQTSTKAPKLDGECPQTNTNSVFGWLLVRASGQCAKLKQKLGEPQHAQPFV